MRCGILGVSNYLNIAEMLLTRSQASINRGDYLYCAPLMARLAALGIDNSYSIHRLTTLAPRRDRFASLSTPVQQTEEVRSTSSIVPANGTLSFYNHFGILTNID